MAKSTKALLTGRIQKCKTNPFIAHIGLATHGRSIQIGSSDFPVKATRQRAEVSCPLPSQSEKCETTTDANLDRGHRMPLGPIAGNRFHPDLSRGAFRI